MTKIENALLFATKAHAGKYRKGTDRPYIIHPIEVMSIVMHFTDDEDVLTAAVLHDTVEDTAVTIQRVEKEFGSRVAELVASVTEDKKRKLPPEATWRARKWEMLFRMKKAEWDVRIVWFADCLSNMRDIKMDYENIKIPVPANYDEILQLGKGELCKCLIRFAACSKGILLFEL